MSDSRNTRQRKPGGGPTTTVTAATTLSTLAVARTAHAAGGGQLTIALVGCGGRGTGAAANCLSVNDDVKLIAVADAFEDQALRAVDALKKRFDARVDIPRERVFVGFDAYRQAIDSGADLMLLVTPPGFRPMQYRAAVEAGKHVFMEKPVCVDAPGFRSVMDTNRLADEKNLKIAVGLNSRHTFRIQETVERVHDGAVGKVGLVRAYCNNAGVWVRPRKPEQTEMEYQMRNWFYFVWLCGDHIVEQHIHLIDQANWLMGEHPVEANGMGGREVRKGRDHGQIYDHHFVEFTYADGSKMMSQCRHIPGAWSYGGTIAHGLKGTADTHGTITGANAWNFDGENVDGHQQEHVDWIGAIRRDAKYNEGWFGATSSMTAVLGRMATYSGQVVRWDDAVAKGPNEMPDRFAFDAPPPVLPDENGDYPVPIPGVYKPY